MQLNSLTFNTSTESVTVGNLRLQEGIRYYSNVRARNILGLYTLQHSDGFVVDVTRPVTGTVYDGEGRKEWTFY